MSNRSMILPQNFKIRNHAAERFLERIIELKTYTQEDVEIAIEIIRNILTNRAIKQQKIDTDYVRLIYSNSVFIYDIDTNYIITVYVYNKAKTKASWEYKFPASLRFKGFIDTKQKIVLITEGFIPLRKEGRLIIGKTKNQIYQYDPKYNVISLFEGG